ncbi:cyclase family protein [Pseudonocardia nigra]|uniref:cyclase family protein n=1 Tax=Pseudonocardia nigra TaxID=1921578 RepID=UPI001C606C5C|nr:cyclase family protein [Pseudonocardia nigra]
MSEDYAPWEMDVRFPAPGAMRVFDLAQLMYTGIPHHPVHPPYSFVLTKRHGDVVYPGGVSGAAAMITTGDHVGTHVDGFAHVAKLGKLYNGVDIEGNQSYSDGMGVHSVHEMAPIVGPGHVVDMPTLLGRELTPADGVTGDHLAKWFAEHGPEPTAGSVVLVRTGWDQHWADPARFLAVDTGAPGMSLDGARWLSERGIRASGCDTVAYEQMPSPSLDVHVHLLVENGISIMEAMNLKPVVVASAWIFFFVAAPLRIKGGTGSPIRPLAFVPQAET